MKVKESLPFETEFAVRIAVTQWKESCAKKRVLKKVGLAPTLYAGIEYEYLTVLYSRRSISS